ALYREINLNAYQISYEKAFNMLSKDILNPLVYTFAVNDMFFRRNNIKISNNIYTKDRGYIFENQLNNNTNNLLNKKLIKYRKPEAEGKIPQLIFSPTIANDGRRLLIGANNLYCLTQNQLNKNINPVSESIFFNAYFKNQFADSLEFSSALRMNSTFPYITPNVT